ncbi:MAG: hypothetical protein A2675_02165 [Candidatus Yonathbacteria bacterium RIFCSPHIGHO2_01_FULL_51_10]|uniref:Uncharacterized protein n=1 Tax=Candidatus Yonathbacteria bacterium RIFCSPHIGHO2_01_FULL_51_10 TaxID=1802723 RepID=A0A1G2S746_9BACT|nr:MAG: hypothetical protein A2675_02165 [Candidatus Yonathbacteria bacterium RIFCSPHIGHO2_01_FULL_51_10]
MIKEFLIKKMIKSKMPGVSDEQIDQVINLVQKNPALFQKIAEEAQAKIKAGMGQEQAMMAVMQAHAAELKALNG